MKGLEVASTVKTSTKEPLELMLIVKLSTLNTSVQVKVNPTDSPAVKLVLLIDPEGTGAVLSMLKDFGNFWSITKVVPSEGFYSYSIFVNDTSSNFFQSGTNTFEVDNTAPVVTYIFPNPDNTSTSRSDIGILNVTGTNINLVTANLTIFNSTNELVFQNLTTGLMQGQFNITVPIPDAFAGQPEGTYTVRSCFIDAADIETCFKFLRNKS